MRTMALPPSTGTPQEKERAWTSVKPGLPFAGEEKQLREGGRGLFRKGNRVRQQIIMIILDMTQIKRLRDLVCGTSYM